MVSAPEAEHWPEALKGSLKYLGELIQHWHAVSGDPAQEPKAKDKLLKAAREIAAPKSWPMLHRKSTPESLKDLLEVLVDVGDIDVDDDKGQRMVETEHAYSITGLVLKNAKGEDVQVDPATLAQKAGDIDAHKSQVTIRNPHRTDEPSVHGDKKPDDGKDDGNFTVDLEEFFRNFSTLDFAVIQH